jgi:hypothetical protein
MACGVIYSTNPFLKFQINEKYIKTHYVWCSEHCDSTAVGAYTSGALTPPSSNPAEIFRSLRDDVRRGDTHSAKINQQKASLAALAVDWDRDGMITSTQRDEIIFMVEHAIFEHWRPLLYVIAVEPVKSRMKLVHISKRAGLGEEYIIEDLKRSEFDLIEL